VGIPNISVQAACLDKPSWVTRPGLRRVDDLGNGSGVALAWQEARPVDFTQQIHYNVYAADTRFDLLNNEPLAITTAQEAVVNISPGNMFHFVVRATEFVSDLDITGMEQIGVDLFKYPAPVTLVNDLPESEDGYTVLVSGDISDYPDIGELLINTEIMLYSSKDTTNNGFVIAINDRAIQLTTLQDHDSGDEVKLWHGVEDGNTIIRQGIASWHQVIPQLDTAVGQFNADADGYRAANADILTTDLTASDANTADFPHYDFKGYHRPRLQDTFSGKCVGSYLGGEFNGLRGLNLQDRTIAREDAMLQVTGEPVILLRRKWSGRRCKCMGMRREHQRTRCDRCFGTGFEGGYNRFVNARAISETFVNTCGFIMIRVKPHTDDLDLKLDQGLIQDTLPEAWTLVFPSLKDRDVIVRFTEQEGFTMEEFRYEILDVTRNKLFFSFSGQQSFKMRRLDKTDVIYQFDVPCPPQ